jgi:very-short-patch-repair endonuclease
LLLKKKYDSGELDFLKDIQRKTMIQSLIDGKLKTAPISKAEIEIKKTLEELNFRIKPQFLIETLKYDFLLIDYNVVIEFNGDYWHCNPEKYDKNFLNKKKNLYAWELWERDKLKKELAEKKGYKFFTIWEKDYNINKNNEINKIINQL